MCPVVIGQRVRSLGNLYSDRHEYGLSLVAWILEELRVLSEHGCDAGLDRNGACAQLVPFTRWYALFAEASKTVSQASAEQGDWTDLELPGEDQ